MGTQVTWRNLDSARHTSTAVSGEWDSGNLNGSTTFSFTFDEVGTFNYFCTIHQSMTATVTVMGETGEASETTPDLSATMLIPAPIDVSSLIADFELEDLTVPVETKITWRNLDSVQHTSTAVSGEWDSGDLIASATFTFTFNETRAFPYFCTVHKSMTGTVTVVDAVDEMQVEEDTSTTDPGDGPY